MRIFKKLKFLIAFFYLKMVILFSLLRYIKPSSSAAIDVNPNPTVSHVVAMDTDDRSRNGSPNGSPNSRNNMQEALNSHNESVSNYERIIYTFDHHNSQLMYAEVSEVGKEFGHPSTQAKFITNDNFVS